MAHHPSDSSRIDYETLRLLPRGAERVRALAAYSQRFNHHQSDSAIYFATESEILARSIGDTLLIFESQLFLGKAYFLAGRYDDALKRYLSAQALCETIHYTNGLATLQNQIGHLYAEMDRPSEAIVYFKNGLQLDQTLGDTASVAFSYGDIGMMYLRLRQIDEALGYLTKCYALHEKNKAYEEMAKMQILIAEAYQFRGDLSSALRFNLKAVETLRFRPGYEKFHATALRNIGVIYAVQKKYDNAKRYFSECIEIAERGGFKPELRDGHFSLSQVYAEEGQYGNAYAHVSRYLELKDSLFNREIIRKMETLQRENQLAKSERELDVLRQESKIQTLEFEQLKFFRTVSVIIIILLILIIILSVFAYRLRQSSEAALVEKNALLQKQAEELDRLARTDALTGIANRRAFEAALHREHARSQRYGDYFTVAISDIDFFKKINDTYSHEVGDLALKHVAEILTKNCRNTDLVARFGGEEFVFLFPNTSLFQAETVCEKIRSAVETYPWDSVHRGLKVTLSIGLSSKSDLLSPSEMLSEADNKLYEAKHNGRNQVRA